MTKMDAIEITQSGAPDVLKPARRDRPQPGEGELLIEVRAAGVNRPDVLQRKGLYPPPDGASDLPGLEVAGTVAALGPGAEGFREGDAVMALLPGGGYAGFAVCHARHVLPKPETVSFVEAAAFPETAYTVFANAFEAGGLRAGERLLVHGATSGIGTMAGRMARAFGAEPYGTAGSDAKCRAAEALGYARCLNYREEDWAKLLGEAGGVDVVLDMVGGDYVAKNVSLLREGGRHVSIAFLRGADAQFNVIEVMRKRLVLTGSTLRARPAEEKARLTGEIRRQLLPKLSEGLVTPVIHETFPLADAARAHRLMESSEHVGKIVLTL